MPIEIIEPTVADRLSVSGVPDYGNAFEIAEQAMFVARRGNHAPSQPMLDADIADAIAAHAMLATSPATVTE